MPTFNFSVVKKKDKREHKPAKQYIVLKKGMTGIVCIDINGKFYVNVNDVKVPILKECYSTKGKTCIFSRKLKTDGKKLCIVRTKNDATTVFEEYLPFCPGCVVEGNLLLNPYGTTLFNIKKVRLEYENVDAKVAFLYWKTHYNEIERNRKNNNGV